MGRKNTQSSRPVVRKAVIADVPAIQKLVNHFAEKRRMLSRPLAQIYESVRDYIVVEDEGAVVGSAALHVFWEDLAEIRALAVVESHQKRGLGRQLVRKCCSQARRMGIGRVFALTFEVEFFRKLGFSEIPKSELPHKIWSDCIRCPLFPDCDEVAVITSVGKQPHK
ncbi:MAG: N-acetyltransferase [Planctomycetes bacterium]|nr:N-acetyltransferase [Planctomycetota bacterium]